jgi:hypothetical protein
MATYIFSDKVTEDDVVRALGMKQKEVGLWFKGKIMAVLFEVKKAGKKVLAMTTSDESFSWNKLLAKSRLSFKRVK